LRNARVTSEVGVAVQGNLGVEEDWLWMVAADPAFYLVESGEGR
jgi:hypothetical protein